MHSPRLHLIIGSNFDCLIINIVSSKLGHVLRCVYPIKCVHNSGITLRWSWLLNLLNFSPSGTPSLIDLIFVPSSRSCNVLPPISNSDRNSILCSLSLSTTSPSSSPSPSSSRRVWLYNQADILLINHFLSSIPWISILFTSDVNHAWLVFKHTFLKVMHLTIPSKNASPPPQPPWISRSLLSSFKHRNFLY